MNIVTSVVSIYLGSLLLTIEVPTYESNMSTLPDSLATSLAFTFTKILFIILMIDSLVLLTCNIVCSKCNDVKKSLLIKFWTLGIISFPILLILLRLLLNIIS
jgi:choline-glycine betaine transporter